MKNNGIKIGLWNGILFKRNNMKLILTYRNELSMTPWFNCKHTYLLSIIGLLHYKVETNFDKWVTNASLKRIRKPICD